MTDPTEKAARTQRVLEGEARGDVEETVANILAAASSRPLETQEAYLKSNHFKRLQQPHVDISQQREIAREESHVVTRQYLSHPNPTEAAARRLRVHQEDGRNHEEERRERDLADKQIYSPLLHVSNSNPVTPPPSMELQPLEQLSPEPPVLQNQEDDQQGSRTIRLETAQLPSSPPRRKRGRPAKLRSVIVTPDILRGASSKKRNLSRLQNSPGRRASPPARRPTQKKARKEQTPVNAASGTSNAAPNPPIQLIPAMTKSRSDFRSPPPPAP